MTVIHVTVSLLPVVLFLAGLMLIDSYKLVRGRAVFLSLLVGGVAAGLSWVVNTWLVRNYGISDDQLQRYVAPFVEELFKASYITYILARNRVGFTVDAAITGFAVGAGFAVIENIYYLSDEGGASLRIWVIRGIGTAIMHGGTMAVFAILAKSFRDRMNDARIAPLVIAFTAAFLLHSVYNHFPLGPDYGAAVQVVVFPLIIASMFHESEKRTRSWLGSGFDTDQELLKSIISGDISETRIGEYLRALKERFEGPIVVDMLCLIRIRVELSLRAKGVLMMRNAGFKVQPDPMTRHKFAELKYLEESIGRTGLLAIEPVHKWTRRDLWQLNLIDVSGSDASSSG